MSEDEQIELVQARVDQEETTMVEVAFFDEHGIFQQSRRLTKSEARKLIRQLEESIGQAS